ELANLRWRNIDVVRAGQIVVLGRAQKTKTIRQGLQHTLGKDEPALFGLRGQNLVNQFLLAHSGSGRDVHGLGDLGQRRDGHVCQRGEVKNLFFAIRARPGSGRSLSSGYAAAILIVIVRASFVCHIDSSCAAKDRLRGSASLAEFYQLISTMPVKGKSFLRVRSGSSC